MKFFLIFSVLFLSLVFQLSVFPNFFPANAVPSLILIFIIFRAAQAGFTQIWKEAILAGFLLDIAYFQPVGTHIFSLVAVIFAISFLSKRFLVTHSAWHMFVFCLLIALGTVANDVLVFFILKIATFFQEIQIRQPFIAIDIKLLEKMIFNVLIFVLVYKPFQKFEKYLEFLDQRVAFKK